jgi:hypothetical protein
VALRMRKSFSLGKGVRMSVGKSGVGVSFGGKGLRYSVHSSGRRRTTVGIPGTGLSYSSTSGGARRSYSSAAYARREQLRREKEQQKANELRRNELAVKEFENHIEMITGVHKEFDQAIDWVSIHAEPAPHRPPEPGAGERRARSELERFAPRWYEKWFPSLAEKRKRKLEAALPTAVEADAKEYEEWSSLHTLAKEILEGDVDAYFQVIEEMNPLDDLLEFGSGFEFGANDGRTIEVEFRVKSDQVVPKEMLSLTQTGKLSRKEMTKTKRCDLIQDYVSSCAIRIARDMMALLPVEKVIVHAVEQGLNTSTGYEEEMTVLSVAFERSQLQRLNFDRIDPSDALQHFQCHMKFMKTAGFKPVERVTDGTA